MPITIFKLDPFGQEKIRYTGEVFARDPDHIVISASWTLPTRDLGYTRFEPGDHFTEYYYNNRWYNIFEVTSANGMLKGWYCNVAEPAHIFSDRVEQVDLFLDVWVKPNGHTLILDEDEFTAATMLTDFQRSQAQQGLHDILQLVQERQEVFAHLTLESQ
jgi:predicted RNA-binding protein associated with RNAse of E/G family